MIFSYNWLQDYIKEKLPRPKKLAKLLTKHFTEVEEVKKEGKDFILDIDVKPNRGSDCFSHIGLAREVAAITGHTLRIPDLVSKEDKNLKTKDFVGVEVKAKKACFRYTARLIADVEVKPSPRWLKERLEVCGLQAINNVVDVVNYAMLETGQPLHAFDFKKLESRKSKAEGRELKKLIVRFAEKGEKIITLDHQRFELNENILVIADERNPVAIAGIKGGKGPEIDKETKIVVLESANFEPITIRKASRELRLKTDASWRFEHGLDPNLTEMAINRAANLIQELAGGRIAQGLIDLYPQKIKPKRIKLKLDYVERLLGVKIARREMTAILKRLGFKITENKPLYLAVEVPTFRLDISIPEDLVEEVGRIYGYEKIPAVPPIGFLVPPERNLNFFWEELSKNILKEAGFTEVYNYSFINRQKAELLNYPQEKLIELENPISENQRYLSPSLVPNLLENVKENFKYFDEIKIFELGRIFQKLGTENRKLKIMEVRKLNGLIGRKRGTDEIFYELKGVVEILLEKIGINDFEWVRSQSISRKGLDSVCHPQKWGAVKINQRIVGFLGEVSPKILEVLKLKGRVVLFELDFEELQKLASEERQYRPICPYPSATRDLAVLVPSSVPAARVFGVINKTGGFLLKKTDLFDVYQGKEIPQGKKNLAFHLVYQAKDRTLEAKEIDKLHKRIIGALEKNPGWEVRK